MGIRLLLDTHALIWWWTDDGRLPEAARAVIADTENQILVSAASAWEIATKYRIGKWSEVATIIDEFDVHVIRSRFGTLPITTAHARSAGLLEGPHRDPFDRMLIAQARTETMPIVSADTVFHHYGVPVIWQTASAIG